MSQLQVTPVAARWDGSPSRTGTVAVIGLGKIGIPLAARYASAGWRVIGVDVIEDVVRSFGSGRSHVDEPGVAELLESAHGDSRIEATTDHAAAVRRADVVVMIVPIMLTGDQQPDYRYMDSATRAVGAGLRPGTLVVYETTLPVGDTRERFGPMLEAASGLRLGAGDQGLYLAFSPERVFSGRILRDLREYPKLVGGVDAESGDRAVAFYTSALGAEVWRLDRSETAEFAKLAETTYRDVNIALANEFARYADRVGVNILDVIRSANSQPFSHIHQPGIGVGGHCIPVYPHFLLSRASDMSLVDAARRINDGQVDAAVEALDSVLGDLRDAPVLVLGLTYRDGVPELAYSRGVALVRRLRERGAEVWAYDPLLDAEQIESLDASPYQWGTESAARAIVTQTADPTWDSLDRSWFPRLELLYDGRNSLQHLAPVLRVAYVGVGLGTGTGRATNGS
jgi:nucleotide sugar dehydrogenase